MGKLHPKILEDKVLKVFLRGLSNDVLLGPLIGEDAAVVNIGCGKLLVIHPDPISGAIQYLGYLAVHIPSNDVAVTGAKPLYLTDVILLPEGWELSDLTRITDQMSRAASSLGISIIGGHTEYAPGIQHPIVVSTSLGIVDEGKIVRTSGAKPGDYVLMTKYAGVEGTAVLATDFRDELIKKGVDEEIIDAASKFIYDVSVVKEAVALASRGIPTSMHDPTEGGLLGGLAEIAYASGCSINLEVDNVLIHEVTKELCNALGIDPLKMLSSGSLIATVPPDRLDEALKVVKSLGVEASVIGRVVRRSNYLVKVLSEGKVVEIINDAFVEDEIMRLWSSSN